MNRKGQIDGIGILAAFIGIIVGIALLSATYGDIGKTTNLQSKGYGPLTTVTGGQWENLLGKAVTNVAIKNATTGTAIVAGTCPGAWGECNWSTRDNQVVDGSITSQINYTGCDVCAGGEIPINTSYTYQDVGYIPESGGRGLAGMIAIFAAIALLVVALVPAIKGLKDFA